MLRPLVDAQRFVVAPGNFCQDGSIAAAQGARHAGDAVPGGFAACPDERAPADYPRGPSSSIAPPGRHDAERRQLTVMFCDLREAKVLLDALPRTREPIPTGDHWHH